MFIDTVSGGRNSKTVVGRVLARPGLRTNAGKIARVTDSTVFVEQDGGKPKAFRNTSQLQVSRSAVGKKDTYEETR